MNAVSSVRNLTRLAVGFVGKIISGGVAWYGSKKFGVALESVETNYYGTEPNAQTAAPASVLPVKRKPGRPRTKGLTPQAKSAGSAPTQRKKRGPYGPRKAKAKNAASV